MKRASLSIVAVLLATLTSSTPASAAPQIRFLNPSGYTTARVLSDAPDADSTYHVVVWVREIPANPIVEIELAHAVTGTQTFTAERVGSSDTWEAFLPLNVADGTYTLRAILYSGDDDVAVVNQTVTVNAEEVPPPPPADTVEITYPDNGQPTGFFTPKGGRTNTVLDITRSEAPRVRVLYSVSDPGDEPVWTECGTGTFPGNARTMKVRCTLAESTPAADVSALAAVANNTPSPGQPDPLADETGDAHRVFPYVQTPTAVDVDPTSRRAQALGQCERFVATLLDQQARPIAAANIDVHATGPNDQLRFGTIQPDPITTTTSPFQASDANHLNSEPALRCSNDENLGQQGDHNVPGSSDPKHIESTTGTANDGTFAFGLHSDAVGGTIIIVYADANDDDLQQLSEASGGARLGWGQDPPPPTRQLFLDPVQSTDRVGNCRRVELIARQTGSALPNVNVDIHIAGPDETLAFCTPPDGSVGRAPDSFHTDDPSARHLEGETDEAGRFVFGVTSATPGDTSILGWLDDIDDDISSTDELTASGRITWETAGERSISLDNSKDSVRSGGRVRLFGEITGDPECAGGQVVRLKARRAGTSKRFRTKASGSTDAEGNYSFSVIVNRSSDYRSVTPTSGVCQKAISPTVSVRVR